MKNTPHIRLWLAKPIAIALAVSATLMSGHALAQNQRVDEGTQTNARMAEFAGFSFAYRFERDRSVTPFQVFDDGEAMFLQFREVNNLPTMMVRDANGTRVIAPEFDGPYVKIPNLFSRIDLVMPDGRNAAIVSTRRPQIRPASLQPTLQPAVQQTARAVTVPAAQTAQPIQVTPASRADWVAPAPATVSEPAGSAAVSSPAQITQAQEIAELRSQVQTLTYALNALVQRLDSLMQSDSRSVARPAASRLHVPAPVPAPVPPLRLAAASPNADAAPQVVRSSTPTPAPTGITAPVQTAQATASAAAPAPAAAPVASVAQGGVITQGTVPAIGTAELVEFRQTAYEFKVTDGMRLSEAMRQLASQQKLTLDWDTGNKDFIVRFGYTVKAASLEVLLKSVLAPYRLSATVSLGNNLLAVVSAT